MCSIMLCAIETYELYTYFTTLLSASRYISNRKLFNGYSCLRLWQLLWIMRLIIDSCRAALLSRTAAAFQRAAFRGKTLSLVHCIGFPVESLRYRCWNKIELLSILPAIAFQYDTYWTCYSMRYTVQYIRHPVSHLCSAHMKPVVAYIFYIFVACLFSSACFKMMQGYISAVESDEKCLADNGEIWTAVRLLIQYYYLKSWNKMCVYS